MTHHPVLCYGAPLSQQALDRLKAEGLLPELPPAPPAPALAMTLTPAQERIWRALTDRPLNVRQRELLGIYWEAREDEGLGVDEASRRLGERLGIDPVDAIDFVKGALRSFGKRLFKTHDMAARDVPLTTMLSIEDVDGASRHRLTANGVAAVGSALGLAREGDGSGSPVLLAMSPLSAALVLRVQADLRCSLDKAIQAMAAKMGAG